jgi:hypothetical protein
MRSAGVWRLAPQRVDPMSWFTRPLVPLGFGAMVLFFGFAVLSATWRLTTEPWLDIVAVLLMASACALVQLGVRPLRPAFGVRQAVAPLGLTVTALVLSTASGLESTVLAQHWWAPIGVSFVVATLGPYSSVRATLAYGSGLTAVTAVCGAIAFVTPAVVWPPLSVAVITGGAVAVATVATCVFSWVFVSSARSLPDGDDSEEPSLQAAEAARRVERRTLARLGTRVAPFLASIADAGEVTAADRALAGQLARRLRSDLVSQANRTWLDRVAMFGRIYVVDPGRRADRMNPAQRTALRALLMAVIEHPAATVGTLFIELRPEDDESTAVALSLDFALPEGRRAMMLAPYYLTLQATVDDLSWDPARDLLQFQLPAPGDRP